MKYGKNGTVTCMQYIVPVHNNGRCYKLMREPCNIKDSNAVAIVRGKSGDKETKEADDVHSNNVTDRFEVICPVPALMATWLSKFLKSLRKSNNQGETIGFVWVLENLESILEFCFDIFQEWKVLEKGHCYWKVLEIC